MRFEKVYSPACKLQDCTILIKDGRLAIIYDNRLLPYILSSTIDVFLPSIPVTPG